MISPPGSPPVGWEQTLEEAPNAAPLAADLINALRKLEIQAEFSRTKVEGRNGVEVLIDPEDGYHGISVIVEDCDPAKEEEMDVYGDDDEGRNGEGWAYGESSRYRMGPGGALPAGWRPIPTSRPPMSISI